jgi:hypothetical protein
MAETHREKRTSAMGTYMNFTGTVAAVDEILLVDWSFFGLIQSSGRTTQQSFRRSWKSSGRPEIAELCGGGGRVQKREERKKTRGERGKHAVAPWGETRVTRGDLDLGTPTRLLLFRPASQPPTGRSPLPRNPPAVLFQSHAPHGASGVVPSSGGGALTAG